MHLSFFCSTVVPGQIPAIAFTEHASGEGGTARGPSRSKLTIHINLNAPILLSA